MGKQHRIVCRNKGKRASEILDLVHSDLCGPSDESLSGAKYFVTFIDDYSRKTFVYVVKHKNEIIKLFKDWKTLVENQTGKKLKCLRTDNGLEYLNKEMDEFLKENGVVHQTTIPRTPEQNGVAERANRTIVEKTRTFINDAGLDKRF
jgi:transposase InsO family protein